MKTIPWVAVLGCAGGVYLRAQSPSGGETSFTPPAAAATSAKLNAVNTDALGAAIPAASAPADTSDKTLFLPRVIVQGSDLPNFSERDRLTKAEFSLLLRKRYPGASLPGQDPDRSSLPNYAAQMYSDDLRLVRMGQIERLSAVTALEGDAAQAKALKEEAQKTYLRKHDWRTEGMDKSVNGWRR